MLLKLLSSFSTTLLCKAIYWNIDSLTERFLKKTEPPFSSRQKFSIAPQLMVKVITLSVHHSMVFVWLDIVSFLNMISQPLLVHGCNNPAILSPPENTLLLKTISLNISFSIITSSRMIDPNTVLWSPIPTFETSTTQLLHQGLGNHCKRKGKKILRAKEIGTK